MRTITLSGAELADAAALHAELAKQLDFPGWYGNNLDALHDLLAERRESRRFLIRSCRALRARLGNDYVNRFFRVLRDSGAELSLWDG